MRRLVLDKKGLDRVKRPTSLKNLISQRPLVQVVCLIMRLIKKQKSKKSSSEEKTRKKHKSHKTKKSKSSIIRQLPRNLTYDGKGSWMAFKEKFTRYAKTCEWTKKEYLNYLCWCLTDKASDFYALLMESSDRWTYSRLLRRLEERFGIKSWMKLHSTDSNKQPKTSESP